MDDTVLTNEQIATVRHLTSRLTSAKVVLIGATALSFYLEMRWRKTYDLDLLLLISGTTNEFDLEADLDWIRQDEHRWVSSEGVPIDVIVVESGDLSSKKKVWSDGSEMSLGGVNVAFRECVIREISPRVLLPIASLPTIVFLKMVSYMDRPSERTNDLADLAYILTDYVDNMDERRFTGDLVELGMEFDQASPYLMGQDLSRILDPDDRSTVDRFVTKLLDDDDSDQSQIWMARGGPQSWDKDVDNVISALEAFQLGFASKHS